MKNFFTLTILRVAFSATDILAKPDEAVSGFVTAEWSVGEAMHRTTKLAQLYITRKNGKLMMTKDITQ